ncbi:GH36-type glycosyl hydrolase domain-containing protein [Marinicellulosiphila megalodicopiae]|uniref:GH36-type glycosyl hydrolase domain-containing protein n=1 Tax=Marinicellulosiphila megalodicopiae TaxID=2724896 RepID=UPI003BAE430D
MSQFIEDGAKYLLDNPDIAPNSAAYLWNKKMMVQVSCRGYAVGQFMQPEPAKYAHIPSLAAKSFMQPEQPYFSHHPGRFFYVRDDETGEMFSAPYEPMKVKLDDFKFIPGLSDVTWVAQKFGIEITIRLTLVNDEVAEVYQVSVKNLSNKPRKISLIPYFPVGYSSWMNMGGDFDKELNAVVCTCISPYQKVEDHFKQKHFKDITYLTADRTPNSYEVALQKFEGDGGLHNPSALQDKQNLTNGNALYEMPACIMQFELELASNQQEDTTLLFGPAFDKAEIKNLKAKLFDGSLNDKIHDYEDYIHSGNGCFDIHTPDDQLNNFVNNWLPRQVFYHGDSNRLSTDPQTRNYLQDAMGMAYIKPDSTRASILHALSQQESSGAMPDGILLTDEAELKYINQIPHTDHPVWLTIVIEAYLNETADWAILDEQVKWGDSDEITSVYDHLSRAMQFLIKERDHRGLNYIAQGDWCDPMNMVGYKGKGVSGWLTEAVSFAIQKWAKVCVIKNDQTQADQLNQTAQEINKCINNELWDGNWYGRGITDDGVIFGVNADKEGKIFLNAQSWALMCGAPSDDQKQKMFNAIDEQLNTPYGVMMYAPAYTAMRDDVGRVTQKWPGSAENGSVYNHAAAFYASSLYQLNESDKAFDVLRKMISGPNDADIKQRGQLPVYIPNYYRGAYYQFPRTAGRSSHLFNTGTAAWFYRLTCEEMMGLKGCPEGLNIQPKLPSQWQEAHCTREFRGAIFNVRYIKSDNDALRVDVNAETITDSIIRDIKANTTYDVVVYF